MLGTLVKRIGLLVGTGALVFVFLLIAQVNMDDLRHKIGDLIEANDPTVRVGALYVVTPYGQLRPGPPVCRPSMALLEEYFRVEEGPVRLRNSLGAAVPFISRVSTALISPTGGVELLPEQVQAAVIRHIDGHTMFLNPVLHVQLESEDMIQEYTKKLFKEKPYCESAIHKHWEKGNCVALVHRVSRVENTVVGFAFNGSCFVPNVPAEHYDGKPLTVPEPFLRITARLSLFKDYVGLISHEPFTNVGPTTAGTSANDGHI